MNPDIDLVKNALEQYDIHREKLDLLLHDATYIDFEQKESDLEKNVVNFYDKDKNKILSSRYENIGIYYYYDSNNRFWTWAWSVPVHEKKQVQTIKRVLNHGIDLPAFYGFLKTELTSSHFSIYSNVQLEMHCAVASYIAKVPYVFEYINHPIVELEKTYGSEKNYVKLIKNIGEIDSRIESLNKLVHNSHKDENDFKIIDSLLNNKNTSQPRIYYLFLLDVKQN